MGTTQEPDATQSSGSPDSPDSPDSPGSTDSPDSTDSTGSTVTPDPTVVAVVLASSAEAVQDVRSQLAEAGFDAGPASGPTFAIVGPASTFREIFGVLPVRAPDGGWTTEQGDEFPLDRLPATTQQQLVAVALERPVELHDAAGLDDGLDRSDP